ncbi:MAG TPA: IclR family transcriptional regulator C-terminal domain-containing protein [Acidimicrobiia bacterium]|nr:IclR family transcriptional regulator C-terminal domain-containing protein [Acidimicrobiia bacterium]
MPEERSGDFIQSLERGLAVIDSFSKERPAQTLSEVAELTGLTRATVRRMLLTLAELGYVRRNGRLFSLTPKVLDLGYSFLSSFQVLELAQGPMERLVEAVKESSSLSILDGSDIVYVARVPTTRIMTISLALGSRLPAYPTSMGRVLMASRPDSEIEDYIARTTFEPLTRYTTTDKDEFRAILHKTRDQGYALVDQELEEGVRSLAAPIHNSRGEVLAAMNVSCHATRADMTRLREEFLPQLLATAQEVSKQAGAHRVG